MKTKKMFYFSNDEKIEFFKKKTSIEIQSYFRSFEKINDEKNEINFIVYLFFCTQHFRLKTLTALQFNHQNELFNRYETFGNV